MTQLVRKLVQAPLGAVITIGNFDGVHLGHQALLKKVTDKARSLKTTSMVMTFEPQPYEFFTKNEAVPRLTPWREKFDLLAQQGIDTVLVVRFDAQFAAMTAEQFVQNLLSQTLQVKHVIVGDDFQFGKGRQGNFEFLNREGAQCGFTTETMPTLLIENERVSSTRIRQALEVSDLALAEKLLGRPYMMEGKVAHGDKLGRQLGFPTANISLHRAIPPVQGIYIVRLHGIAPIGLPGVANVGTRPTLGGTRSLLEVHLFDFQQEIYGRRVQVEFCKKLRDEERYETLDLLKDQIGKDAKQARDYFERRGEL